MNVSRPSAADGRLLNNFDNAVVAVEGLWVYVMSQTKLREGDQEQTPMRLEPSHSLLKTPHHQSG